MSKIAVVYWSGTGNTQAMAEAVAEGAKEKGAEAALYTALEFDASRMDDFDAVAFGCPSMGAEQLEESEFEPMFSSCEPKLTGRRSRCSVPTAGETASGCVTGRKPVFPTGQFWRAIRSSATTHRMTIRTQL